MSSRLLQFHPVVTSVKTVDVAPAFPGVVIKSTDRA
jgi:hypothetical protein